MKQTIKHQYFFPHTPEMVWEYLTNPELMELWLMKTNFTPVVGADFQFKTNPIPALDFDGTVYCKVLEIMPFTGLSYSWNCGPGDGIISLNSVVAWKLEETTKGTNVYLEHSGFEKKENLAFFNGFNHGWTTKFPKIEQLLIKRYDGNSNS
jgi:uncharacterized protein YndB with AHSA1/START domain